MRATTAFHSIMSSSKSPIFEGVFAIHKPPSISSAQVIRDLQTAFLPSTLFAPMIADMRVARDSESRSQRNRRRDKNLRLKIGHGGTLDPLATGVLIIGIGRGTKSLGDFLNCTKSYHTEVLFGAATDTYDVVGKVLSRAPWEHVTREKVEGVLSGFRGKVLQMPPIYSALKMDGKKLYESAREGKEPPREIQRREVTVERLEIVGWEERHGYSWPSEEAPVEEKLMAEKVLEIGDVKDDGMEGKAEATGEKRRRDGSDETWGGGPAAKRLHMDDSADPVANGQASVDFDTVKEEADASKTAAPAKHEGDEESVDTTTKTEQPESGQAEDPHIPPVVALDMTVTSGFYVRSLCHDLGKAVGSNGLMASLVRTRQGEYILGENVFEYDDLKKGEEIWGPKIQSMLENWMEKNPR